MNWIGRMETIDIDLFLTEYNKIEEKLSNISMIPKLHGEGKSYEGIEITNGGIVYRSSTSYSGCGSDYFSFFVKWEEMNNPIEYFQEKYAKEIQRDLERKQQKQEKDNLETMRKELELAKVLFEKYKDEL